MSGWIANYREYSFLAADPESAYTHKAHQVSPKKGFSVSPQTMIQCHASRCGQGEQVFLVTHKTQKPSNFYRHAAGAMRVNITATSQGQSEEK